MSKGRRWRSMRENGLGSVSISEKRIIGATPAADRRRDCEGGIPPPVGGGRVDIFFYLDSVLPRQLQLHLVRAGLHGGAQVGGVRAGVLLREAVRALLAGRLEPRV